MPTFLPLVTICMEDLGLCDGAVSPRVIDLNQFKLLGLHFRISHSLNTPLREWQLKVI